MDVRQELLNSADINYKEFHKKLVPTVDENKIIGVRIPQLRKIGKKLENNSFEWYFYEEIMLHGFYIGYKKLDYKERLALLDEFVPRIDNWAVCDCVCSTLKFIEKNKISLDRLILLNKVSEEEIMRLLKEKEQKEAAQSEEREAYSHEEQEVII